MKDVKKFKIFLIILLLAVVFFTFLNFGQKNLTFNRINKVKNISKDIKIKKNEIDKKEEIEQIEEIYSSNIIENVNYIAKDLKGNEYTINASKGEIDIKNNDIIFLTNVEAYIRLDNSEDIRITSKFGKYNILNNDTIFSKKCNSSIFRKQNKCRISRFFYYKKFNDYYQRCCIYE